MHLKTVYVSFGGPVWNIWDNLYLFTNFTEEIWKNGRRVSEAGREVQRAYDICIYVYF